MQRVFYGVGVFAIATALLGCTPNATLPSESGYGPTPFLPAQNPELIPTVDIAPVKHWQWHEVPRVASGLRVTRCAERRT